MPPNSRIGEAVALSATLQPPPEPIESGGFDFGRQAWFASLGATGYATSKIQSLNDAGALPWDLRAWSGIDALRARVNARIRAALEGETGEIAVALITGARGGISEELNQAMRDSGLAHILSISGLRFTSRASQFGRSRLGRRPWVPDRVVLKRAPPPPAPGNDAADPISDWAAIQKNKDQ